MDSNVSKRGTYLGRIRGHASFLGARIALMRTSVSFHVQAYYFTVLP